MRNCRRLLSTSVLPLRTRATSHRIALDGRLPELSKVSADVSDGYGAWAQSNLLGAGGRRTFRSSRYAQGSGYFCVPNNRSAYGMNVTFSGTDLEHIFALIHSRHPQRCLTNRSFSTAAEEATPCADDCGKPCPEDCSGYGLIDNEITSYFEIIGISPKFDLDLRQLKSSYRTLMAQHHPDKHHSLHDPEYTMEEMAEKSSQITRAYDTLRHPLSRAEHMLKLYGRPITESCGGELVSNDMELLMEVMTIREEIDQAEDDADNLRHLLEENQIRVKNTVEKVGLALDGEPELDEARRWTARLRYWKRIEEKILEKLSTVR